MVPPGTFLPFRDHPEQEVILSDLVLAEAVFWRFPGRTSVL